MLKEMSYCMMHRNEQMFWCYYPPIDSHVAGTDSSCLGVKVGRHPELVASSSQRQTNIHTDFRQI